MRFNPYFGRITGLETRTSAVGMDWVRSSVYPSTNCDLVPQVFLETVQADRHGYQRINSSDFCTSDDRNSSNSVWSIHHAHIDRNRLEHYAVPGRPGGRCQRICWRSQAAKHWQIRTVGTRLAERSHGSGSLRVAATRWQTNPSRFKRCSTSNLDGFPRCLGRDCGIDQTWRHHDLIITFSKRSASYAPIHRLQPRKQPVFASRLATGGGRQSRYSLAKVAMFELCESVCGDGCELPDRRGCRNRRQVFFRNLIRNAMPATSRPGEDPLSIAGVEPDAGPPASRVRLTNGPRSLTPNNARKVFEPFPCTAPRVHRDRVGNVDCRKGCIGSTPW